MRHLAITGIETAAIISRIFLGLAMRATPPSARICAGTRSRAITETAPAFSAMTACSALVTSMMTPPLSISARPVLRRREVVLEPLFWDMGEPCGYLFAIAKDGCQLSAVSSQLTLILMVLGGASPLNHSNARRGFAEPRCSNRDTESRRIQERIPLCLGASVVIVRSFINANQR